jgi:D-3-phosphoglycerate dehydrogenase
MSLGKVIFIDSVHKILWERLSSYGWECFDKTKTTPEKIKEELSQYNGIVIRSKFKLTSEILSNLPNLKFIARAGSGLENINTEFAKKRGIQVFNSPEGNRDALAEHTIGMLLMLQNNLKKADLEVRSGIWKREENRGFELKGKTIGLIGYGVMAKAFAKRLKGFELNIIAFDKFKSGFSDNFVKEVSLKELQGEADIISLHTNFLPENKYFFDEKFIKKCKNKIVLINTARGFNVNTKHLVDALRKGKVKGACLDVLEFETISFENFDNANNETFHYLVNSKQVILSPHIAGWSHESYFKLSNVLADKIEEWIAVTLK